VTSSDGFRIDILGVSERTKAIADAIAYALNKLEETEAMKRPPSVLGHTKARW
jgi:hypothetical protein